MASMAKPETMLCDGEKVSHLKQVLNCPTWQRLLTTDGILPGWFCGKCKAFNGSMKELLTRCRCCDALR